MVVIPLTIRATKIAHFALVAGISAARITTTGVSTMPAMISATTCPPIAAANACGGLSDASSLTDKLFLSLLLIGSPVTAFPARWYP